MYISIDGQLYRHTYKLKLEKLDANIVYISNNSQYAVSDTNQIYKISDLCVILDCSHLAPIRRLIAIGIQLYIQLYNQELYIYSILAKELVLFPKLVRDITFNPTTLSWITVDNLIYEYRSIYISELSKPIVLN